MSQHCTQIIMIIINNKGKKGIIGLVIIGLVIQKFKSFLTYVIIFSEVLSLLRKLLALNVVSSGREPI